MFRFTIRLAVVVITLALAGRTWSHLVVYRRCIAEKKEPVGDLCESNFKKKLQLIIKLHF